MRWEPTEFNSKLLEKIESLEKVLSGEVEPNNYELNEMKINYIWIKYVAETMEAPNISEADRIASYKRLVGLADILIYVIADYEEYWNNISR